MKHVNKLTRIMLNLTYVTVDRAAATNHWWKMVECVNLDREFWSVNQTVLVSQKAVAGILSHRQTRGFVAHRIKERRILRHLKQNEAAANSEIFEREHGLPCHARWA